MSEYKSRTFDFGKIDYYGKGRKINKVEVEIDLKETDRGPVFSANGTIWNCKQTDCVSFGQNLDEISEYISSPLFKQIYRLWKLYHLNDLHAGTKAQEKIINDAFEKTNEQYDYDKACSILDKEGLLIDNGYKYGSGWLYEPIPEEDLKEIESIFKS